MCVVEDLPALKDLQEEEEGADKEADQDRTDPWESLAKVVLGVWKAAGVSKVYVDHQVFLDRMVDQVNPYSPLRLQYLLLPWLSMKARRPCCIVRVEGIHGLWLGGTEMVASWTRQEMWYIASMGVIIWR